MNIVYGGSFNPPTIGHLNIVRKLLNDFSSSKVIILPVGNAYGKNDLINFNDRFNMLEILFRNNDRVIISKLEDENKFLGTLDSLNKLSEIYGKLMFVIGSDNITDLDKWIDYKSLLSNYPLIIIKRNNDDIKLLMSKYLNLNVLYYEIDLDEYASSSLFRSDTKKYRDLISSEVLNYIEKNKLYKG